MITTKGGYAIADLTFLTENQMLELIRGSNVQITRKQFEQIFNAFNSNKPVYIALYAPSDVLRTSYVYVTFVQNRTSERHKITNAYATVDLTRNNNIKTYEFSVDETNDNRVYIAATVVS